MSVAWEWTRPDADTQHPVSNQLCEPSMPRYVRYVCYALVRQWPCALRFTSSELTAAQLELLTQPLGTPPLPANLFFANEDQDAAIDHALQCVMRVRAWTCVR
mmetsp:Transcript_70844/g.140428  ORF Transcript_70844/g.140428 Transcript_70844/m.140428 type:complete len:103 (-) Transcript_70844:446-754(-)